MPALAPVLLPALCVALLVGAPQVAESPAPPGQPAPEGTEQAPAADAAKAETVTWDALTAEVERTSPLMAAARAGLQEFEAKLSRADWAWFPSFKLEGGLAAVPAVSGEGFSVDIDWGTWGYYYRVSLTMVQPVFTFGRIGDLKDAAQAGVDVGFARIEAARWELRYRAAQAFWGAVLSRELDAIFVDGKAWLDKSQARMERLRDEDSDDYDQMEHLRLKTRVSEFYELEAQNKLLATTSSSGLRLLLQRPPGIEVTPAVHALEPVEVSLGPVEDYVALAERNEPTVRMARAGASALDALASAKEAEVWPTLVVIGDVRVNDSNVLRSNTSVPDGAELGVSGGVLLGVRWNLDVAQRVFAGQEARAKADRTHAEAVAARDLAEHKVRELYQRLAGRAMMLDVLASSQKAAQGWLTATWDGYDAGFGSFKEVMDALVQYYGKRVGYLRAVYEHNVLVVELSRAVGRDITTLPALTVQ